PAWRVWSKNGDRRRRAPRWMRAMSNGFRFSDDRRRDDAVRLDLFAAMLNFLRHPCRGRAAIVEGPIKNSIRDVAGRGPAQGTRTQAASSASNTDFGGQPSELAYALKSRRLLPRFNAARCNSRLRSPMIPYVDASPGPITSRAGHDG